MIIYSPGVRRAPCSLGNFNWKLSSNHGEFSAILLSSNKKRGLDLLENHIGTIGTREVPTEWIKFISNGTDLEISQFLDNKSSTHTIYLSFQLKKFEADIEENSMLPSEAFRMSIINALKNSYPYEELTNTFTDYGYFVPRKVIIGHKLYKISHIPLNQNLDSGDQALDEIQVNIDLTPKLKNEIKASYCENLLRQWKIIAEPYGIKQNYFLSTSGEVIKENDVQKWMLSCETKTKRMKVIGYEDLLPSYEILDEPLRSQVKSIIEIDNDSFVAGYNTLNEPIIPKIKERIFMAGTIPLKNANKYYRQNYREFQTFGAHGFLALIETLGDSEMDFSNMEIDWIAIGIPLEVGCYSPKTRSIFILNMGSKSIPLKSRKLETMDLSLEILDNLPPNSYLVTTFEYPLSNHNPKFCVDILSYNGGCLNLRIINSEQSKIRAICENSNSSQLRIIWYILTVPEMEFHEMPNIEFASKDFMKKIGRNIHSELETG
ncbi:14515_t:CDS:2 [Acaulospora colombiana]|uniref:14515_t:CDS:1 n=1 Tax=Acaulospora colombiana TaxID=27376 RepID=A0ACA9LP20_9GLOM|nr:14515_t:CDS:2 [Acaulospora colombiana]